MFNNRNGGFFKFKNVQIVCLPNSGRQARRNTQINAQGTAEDQFAEIAAVAHAETLDDIDDIFTDDDSIDYSPPYQHPIDAQIQVQTVNQQPSDSDDTSNITTDSVTDSSLDTFSIQVIQPHAELEIQLPINPLQQAPPKSLKSPKTNVTAHIPDGLITGDEETEDQVVPPAIGALPVEIQGRRET